MGITFKHHSSYSRKKSYQVAHALPRMCAIPITLPYVKKAPQVLVIALAANHLPRIHGIWIFHPAVNLENLSLQLSDILNFTEDDILLGWSWLSLGWTGGVTARFRSIFPSVSKLPRRNCKRHRLFPDLNNLCIIRIIIFERPRAWIKLTLQSLTTSIWFGLNPNPRQ